MIRIFQRHCQFSANSANKKRPEWFDREKIFNNLMLTIFDDKYIDKVKYTAFYDTTNGKDHFIFNKDIDIIETQAGGEASSFTNLLNYVIEQDYDGEDIIYFVEDDYTHQYGWVDILQEGVKQIGADYYTLYDHPDKYYLPMYENLQSKIIATDSIHWRTTPSTTCTFACKFKTLKKYIEIHLEFCKGDYTRDHNMFTELWKKGSNLVSCIPGYATHVEANMLSPIIDWKGTCK